MMQKANLTIDFPVGGLDCRSEYDRQFSLRRSFDAVNVWPVGPNLRLGGGSRPVLTSFGEITGEIAALCGIASSGSSQGMAVVTSDNKVASTNDGTFNHKDDIYYAGDDILISDTGESISFASEVSVASKLATSGNNLFAINGDTMSKFGISEGVVKDIVNLPCSVTTTAYYRERLFVTDGLGKWWASRAGKVDDFDLSGDMDDSSRAIMGTLSDCGLMANNIIAMFPWNSGEALIFGCSNSLWLLSGDPVRGGSIRCVSWGLGIIGESAWTIMPDNSIMFLSNQGLCRWSVGGVPQVISDDRIPGAFRGLITGVSHVVEYDSATDGVFVFVKNTAYEGCWISNTDGGFWIIDLQNESVPISSVRNNGDAVFLCADGTLRKFQWSDHEIDSHVMIGPFRLSQGNDSTAILSQLWGEMTARVNWSLSVGDTAYQAVSNAINAKSVADGIWSGEITKAWPRAGGEYAVIKLSATGPWAFGSMTAITQIARRR